MNLTWIGLWRSVGFMPIVGALLWWSPAFAGVPTWEALQQAIVAQQASLAVAICRQQWQSAIDLTTGLIGIPQLSADQRQAYVNLRHVLEDLQSRSLLPNFVVNFDNHRLPELVSTDRCGAIVEKVNLTTVPPLVPVDPPLDWQPAIDRYQNIYSP